jgi:hypothetical protein
MESSRFDALARSLSRTPSRRGALRSLLGLMAVLPVGAAAATRQAQGDARKKRQCTKPADCKKPGNKCKQRTCQNGACGTRNRPENSPCGDGKRCCAGKCRACCVTDDCPAPACQTCSAKGVCKPANQGQVCSDAGPILRCCDGACPDPACRTSGDPAVFCVGTDNCDELDCCTEQTGVCLGGAICSCETNPNVGDPCGSDGDCAGLDRVCICGTCQEAPAEG